MVLCVRTNLPVCLISQQKEKSSDLTPYRQGMLLCVNKHLLKPDNTKNIFWLDGTENINIIENDSWYLQQDYYQ